MVMWMTICILIGKEMIVLELNQQMDAHTYDCDSKNGNRSSEKPKFHHNKKKSVLPAGLEPAIFELEVQRLIH